VIDIVMRISALLFRFGQTTAPTYDAAKDRRLQKDDLTTYRRLAPREDPFGVLRARSMRTRASLL
jgi:7,8-dihydropterin-6-yl-methyl-4-(beta-D-ribofuranosyl)aminobenzene 5'-phosphate synthase